MKKALVLLACVALVFAMMSCEQEEQAKTAEDYFFVETGSCSDGWSAAHYMNTDGTTTVTLKGNTLSGYIDNSKANTANQNYVRISLTGHTSDVVHGDDAYTDTDPILARLLTVNGKTAYNDDAKLANIFPLNIGITECEFWMYDGEIITLKMDIHAKDTGNSGS